ncbi:TIGR01906 family membrane protein [Oceanirhabdus sp. W0125-5]|uniref:TIGR01906 family membrane protein n=1 Tax=Oceanirhabdus sp. W0125-5 TaxID=2999116 RepID=UPI0022F331B0|nr:TIGR01906 family membrane protein [Oceanirhabdus sp. W0125-5]WBW98568.1 TIGR01906 family membrane protein [Oceanirhabdus sp. W0125-5]
MSTSKKQKFYSWFTSIFLCIAIISGSIIIVFNSRFIYPLSMKILNIPLPENMNHDILTNNYNYIIDFITKNNYEFFNLPNFQSSENGIIHFIEVKNVYWSILYIFILSSIITIAAIYFQKTYTFLKIASRLLIIVVLIITIPSIMLFDFAFDFMHMVVFNNDYWLLDPKTDPIINILPQNLFLIFFIAILGIIILNMFILKFIYNYLNGGENSNEQN